MALEESILTSTKKNLGLDSSFTAYDPDVTMHINAMLSVLNDLGVGPTDGLFIDGPSAKWSDLAESPVQLARIKTWLYLRVRMVWDPPTTSYLIEAAKAQISELEWRMAVYRDNLVDQVEPTSEEVDV